MVEDFHHTYTKLLKEKFPSLQANEQLDINNLISPITVPIPEQIDQSIRRGIKALYKASRQNSYQQKVADLNLKPLITDIPNDSVLMAYDFHIDTKTNQAALIEVNTNASGYLFVDTIYQLKDKIDHLTPLKQSFQNEWRLTKQTGSPYIVIIDERVQDQNMYPEFLMYQDLFNSMGWASEIADVDAAHFQEKISKLSKDHHVLIYNRFCDFTLSEDRSNWLRSNYTDQTIHLTPNPKEYILLADKTRLTEWTAPNTTSFEGLSTPEQQHVKDILIQTRLIKDFPSTEDLWLNRKKLFFKPRQSYGGKATYRGKSITKKIFDRINSSDTIVQSFFPAPELELKNQNNDLQKWKYDLRYYVYQDQIQMVCARLYQGQVTNFKTPGGGFATTKITP